MPTMASIGSMEYGSNVRLGAVSSVNSQLSAHLPTLALRYRPGPALTDTRGLANINGQIGLGPARSLVRSGSHLFQGRLAYRLIVAVGVH